MTPQQILESLKAEGVELGCDQGNLKVRSTKTKVTNAQISLITANKPALLAHLSNGGDERNCGSLAQTGAQGSDTASTPVPPPVVPKVFKEYKLPNGNILQLTREDFDRVVENFSSPPPAESKAWSKG